MVSLVNKMQGTRMGDRYHRSKPQKSDEKREKRQKRDEAQQKFKVSQANQQQTTVNASGLSVSPLRFKLAMYNMLTCIFY